MVHANYHEVEGQNHLELGHQLGRLFGHIVREYIAEEQEDEDWPRLRQKADKLLVLTARYFPKYIEELQAYASAAGVNLLDLWTMINEDELFGNDTEKCTTIISNDGLLIAHNEDWSADALDDICILKKKIGNSISLELYYYGCPLGGVALSVCSNGYVQAVNSLNHTDHQMGVPKTVVARRISEMSDANTELEEILSIPRSSGFAHNLVYRSGHVTSIECTATRHSVRHPLMPFVHTNHMLEPSLNPFEIKADNKSSFKRFESATSLVSASMERDELISLAGDKTAGKKKSVFNKNTIARGIVDLDQHIVSFWLRREKSMGWVEYPIDFLFDHAV
jgi:Acyl-coenzyme A:6-aminopenicillanic acid acyl-transferase